MQNTQQQKTEDFGLHDQCVPAEAMAPGTRLEARECLQAVTFPMPWMRERADRLHRFCQTVERARARGMSVRQAMKYFAWFWRNRSYQAAPHVKARFSRGTLAKLYYVWRRNGQCPASFALHYVDRLAPVPREQMRRFVRACGTEGTSSISQAARAAGLERGEACRILARLPRTIGRRIELIFTERRQAKLEERAALNYFQVKARRRRNTDQRGRHRLEKLAEGLAE